MRLSGVSWLMILLLIFGSCVYHEIEERPKPEPPVDCTKSGLSITVSDLSNASICGAEDGSMQISVSGGVAPYQISVNDEPLTSMLDVQSLASGIYSVTALDANQCSIVKDSILISVDQFQVAFDVTENTGCLDYNGTFTANVTEENGPYQFKVGDGEFTASNHFEGLRNGDHFVSIRDKDGCNVNTRVTIPRGNTGVSWLNDILPIIETSCAKPTCHNGISLPNDWRIYEKAKQYAFSIKTKTQDGSMPFDSVLPQAQIDLIACWVDDGAPEN